jgi:Predicted acyl-CoA transferases/carnitine dehydratase
MMNRNKRGLSLDLISEAGKAILVQLLKDADCVIENFRHYPWERAWSVL